MNNKGLVFVGLDVSKDKISVAIALDGRDGEVRDWGTWSSAPNSVERLLKKLGAQFQSVEICYEAGWTCRGIVPLH